MTVHVEAANPDATGTGDDAPRAIAKPVAIPRYPPSPSAAGRPSLARFLPSWFRHHPQS